MLDDSSPAADFNGAWLAAFSSPASNHLWRNQSPGLGGHTDSLPGPLAPVARASFPLREDSTLPSPTLAQSSGPVLPAGAGCYGHTACGNSWTKASSTQAHRVPAKATEEGIKCTSTRLNPTLCFRGYNLTSGLSRSLGPQAH